MIREDTKRFKNGDPLVDKDELLKMAQDSEAFLLEFETEERAAGLTLMLGTRRLGIQRRAILKRHLGLWRTDWGGETSRIV